MTTRRAFMGVLGGAAAWPLAARAQPALIGFLHGGSQREWTALVTSFLEALKEAGYIEGQNVAIQYRWAEGQFDRLPALAAELVDRKPALIVAGGGTITALAAKRATSTIPVVFVMGGDPVRFGLVASVNRPGGNVTGVSFLLSALVAKRLEFLRAIAPSAGVIGVLFNPANPNAASDVREAQEAAQTLGLDIRTENAGTEGEIEAAFVQLRRQNVGALIVLPDLHFVSRRDQIVTLAARYSLPAIYFLREFAAAGGLMTYSASLADAHHWAAKYVGRILSGEKPGDLPIVQPTKFELVINLKTAKALGLEIPDKLLALADEVIE